MALGDQAGLQAVQAAVAQIPGLEAFLGDRINDLHAALTQTLSVGIAQIGDTALKVEGPVLQRIDDFNASVATMIGLLRGGFHGNIGGMPFTIQATTDVSVA